MHTLIFKHTWLFKLILLFLIMIQGIESLWLLEIYIYILHSPRNIICSWIMYLSIGIFLPNCSFPFSLPTLQFSLNVTAGESLFISEKTNSRVKTGEWTGASCWLSWFNCLGSREKIKMQDMDNLDYTWMNLSDLGQVKGAMGSMCRKLCTFFAVDAHTALFSLQTHAQWKHTPRQS